MEYQLLFLISTLRNCFETNKSILSLLRFGFKRGALRLRHTLHQRTLYSSEHFASQELNTLGSPTHLAKSQFTPEHTLLLYTLCHSEPFTPHYTLLLNTLCHSEPSTPHYTLLLNTLCLPTPFASWSTLLLNTFYSMDRKGNNPIYPLLSTCISTWTEP